MFTGTTPPEVKILLQDLMKGVEQKDVYIGCSGNYSVDKIMAGMGYTVHSNDVSLYSKLIADLLLDVEDTEVKCINEELAETFEKWEETKYKKLCEVMFALRVAQFSQKKNEYQQEMFDTFLQQSEVYYKNTMAKLQKGALDFKIADFYYGDFVDFLKGKKGNGVGISFPPTYKGGYEKIFAYVENSFEYNHAPYNIFDPKDAGKLFGELLESDKNIIYSDREWDNLEPFLAGRVNLGAGKHDVYIYSSVNEDRHYYIARTKTTKPSKLHILPKDYQFTEDTQITVKECPVNDVNYYKAFYMANKVNYSTGGDLGLVFLADGYAFGFCSFSKQLSTLEQIFEQSDFVVNADVPRLSKLLIMLVKSAEVRRVIAKKMFNYYTSVKTTVYTDKPVSMKYRGPWKLERRDKGKLMYVANFVEDSLNTIYKQWYKKK